MVSPELATLNRANATTDNVDALIDELFTYHKWDEEKIAQGAPVSAALKEAFAAIVKNVPSSPSRTRALNMLVDVRMIANQAITFEGQI